VGWICPNKTLFTKTSAPLLSGVDYQAQNCNEQAGSKLSFQSLEKKKARVLCVLVFNSE
jgi:hypothetical protein